MSHSASPLCGEFQPDALGSRRAPPAGWWVVKYYSEERIFLPGLVVTPVPKVPFWKFRNFNVLQPNFLDNILI